MVYILERLVQIEFWETSINFDILRFKKNRLEK